jgi:hypothetical protein
MSLTVTKKINYRLTITLRDLNVVGSRHGLGLVKQEASADGQEKMGGWKEKPRSTVGAL